MSRYFSDAEFRRCSPSCSIDQMDKEFLARLDNARERAGIPFVLNCAYRSAAHDKALGRSGSGAHTEIPCKAVDIRCSTSQNRFKIVKALLDEGFTRIGIGANFIHADLSENLPQCVMFDYYEK